MNKLVDYLIAQSERLPTVKADLYEYLLAGNGVFKRAKHPQIEAMLQINNACVRGLPSLEPYLKMSGTPVPKELLTSIWQQSVISLRPDGHPVEAMFYLWQEAGSWLCEMPLQVQSSNACEYKTCSGEVYSKAVIELHSHGAMNAFFSPQDDADERDFRIYAVIGNIYTTPSIRVRVGMFQDYWEIPANWVFDLPSFIVDVLETIP